MTCPAPLDVALLADYWMALLPEREEEAVELHLLACDVCGERLRESIALIDGLRQLAREGSLRMVVSEAFVRAAAEQGLRVREYAPPPGGGVQCTVTAGDDLLVARLAADIGSAHRVDISICDKHGSEQLRWPDIPVRRGAAGVVFQESMDWAKSAPDHTMILRLVALDEEGDERLLGEYTFNHTRSMPGPAAW
jgi:hypothetical protein